MSLSVKPFGPNRLLPALPDDHRRRAVRALRRVDVKHAATALAAIFDPIATMNIGERHLTAVTVLNHRVGADIDQGEFSLMLQQHASARINGIRHAASK